MTEGEKRNDYSIVFIAQMLGIIFFDFPGLMTFLVVPFLTNESDHMNIVLANIRSHLF